MKTILAAKEHIAQLWGHPKPKDCSYRLMKYLLQTEVEEGILLHNTVTGHLVLLNKEEAEVLPCLPLKPMDLMNELIENHFLVPEGFDEYKSVKQLRSIYRIRQSDDAITRFIILPTTFCNAHCFYCYESDFPHISMSEATAQKVIDYIDVQRKGKGITLGWFGGEPLVGMARIDQISKGLHDREIPFEATMISNGYLFDEKIIEKSVKLWNLTRVQITLDGTEETYNRVKAYVNVKGNPYHRVLKNIDNLCEKGVQVVIRLNVDFYNKDEILRLIEELGARYCGNKNILVYVNMLFNNQGFEPVKHSQEERIELLQIIEDYTMRLVDLKIGKRNTLIPSLQFSQCMADSPKTIEIQPDGSFCRCEHESAFDRYGSLDEGILYPQKLMEWRETIERTDHCPECKVYPFCYLLRGCMNADIPCIDVVREMNQKAHEEQLRFVYKTRMEDEKDEGV